MTRTAASASTPSSPAQTPAARRCRSCDAPLERLFVDLGMSPPCEDFVVANNVFAHVPDLNDFTAGLA